MFGDTAWVGVGAAANTAANANVAIAYFALLGVFIIHSPILYLL